jgi:hypothetical protein
MKVGDRYGAVWEEKWRHSEKRLGTLGLTGESESLHSRTLDEKVNGRRV